MSLTRESAAEEPSDPDQGAVSPPSPSISPGVGGLRLLDAAALVIGAAVASVHVRSAVREAAGAGWALVWLTFVGITLTAAGPFAMLTERSRRRETETRSQPGLWLWGILGIPWVITSVLKTASVLTGQRQPVLYSFCLTLTVAISSCLALAILWKTWIAVPPGSRELKEPHTWHETLGLILAIAFPLQWGFVLVVLDPGPPLI